MPALHYPAICLLIAATHARAAGHEQITFEQLHNDFRDQVRKSTAAPVQMAGSSIGMVRCGRSVLMAVSALLLSNIIASGAYHVVQAFEQLVAMKAFVPAGASAGSANLSREFVKYRCLPDRQDVKQAVDKIGQTNLKKWFGKAT
jgi:origin recognition complex subunit 4